MMVPHLRTVVAVEVRKLRRSLAALLAVAAPAIIAVFMFFNVVKMRNAVPWSVWMNNMAGLWGAFMLPLSITALTALMAQMEHAPKSWDHLRALPVPRWMLYAAKLICTAVLVGAMTVILLALTLIAIEAAAWIKPAIRPGGTLRLALVATILLKMYGAALLMTAIQLWLAIRFTSFVPAISVGIAGAFFAIVSNAAWQGVFLPWQMPINMLASVAWRGEVALMLGMGGGAFASVAVVAHLSRREVL
ncbi:ABC transporter permease [Sphingomonas pituitosa]|uniref:ABC transporter permease n=1 Tax=Sphingomonas pituitosa TaxID=99597 RepID=UPI000ACEE34C|nr:ABC transporter permease [Sphingomonas pituitosa]